MPYLQDEILPNTLKSLENIKDIIDEYVHMTPEEKDPEIFLTKTAKELQYIMPLTMYLKWYYATELGDDKVAKSKLCKRERMIKEDIFLLRELIRQCIKNIPTLEKRKQILLTIDELKAEFIGFIDKVSLGIAAANLAEKVKIDNLQLGA